MKAAAVMTASADQFDDTVEEDNMFVAVGIAVTAVTAAAAVVVADNQLVHTAVVALDTLSFEAVNLKSLFHLVHPVE